MQGDKGKKNFIFLEVSKYALMNPDTSPRSKPVNAHFEINFRRLSMPMGEKGGVLARARNVNAIPAATVRLSGLSSGKAPLFGSDKEVLEFQKSLIVRDTRWKCNFVNQDNSIEFVYSSSEKKLEDDFCLLAYSDAFNSTAKFSGEAAINVESWDFNLYFPDAAEDDYTVTTTQIYVPRITLFKPDGLAPVKTEGTEYAVAFGSGVSLKWTVIGDSATVKLTQDTGGAATKPPEGSEEYIITYPTDFKLLAESAIVTSPDEAPVSFSLTTSPGIKSFDAGDPICLQGSTAELTFETVCALNRTITAKNSTEAEIEIPSGVNKVNVHPALENPANRIVTYTLTANGHIGKKTSSATMSLDIYVSRWTKYGDPSTLPIFDAKDGVVKPFEYLGNYYCLAGRAIWKSTDGRQWTKISQQSMPEGATACEAAFEFFEGNIYILNTFKNSTLNITKYSLLSGQWAGFSEFCGDSVNEGGAFTFIDSDSMYYFAVDGTLITVYNYSPPPFDCWGFIGSLPVQSAARTVASCLSNGKIYIAAACEDNIIRVYHASKDLHEVSDTPVEVRSDSRWIRLIPAGGRLCAVSATGMFDAETGARFDMMFDNMPKLIGNIKNQPAGVSAAGALWTLNL